MPTGERRDPLRGFNFRVEIEGVDVAGFSEVSGLSSDTDVVEYREGTDKLLSNRKLPGLMKYTNIMLKRGYTDNRVLWEMRKQIVNGVIQRRHGSIILQNEEHQEVMRWDFEGGWIHKLDGPALNAKGNEVTIESMELVIESLSLR